MGYKVIFVFADNANEWNCSQWRSLTPSDCFNRHQDKGWQGKLIHISDFINYLAPHIQDWLKPADVIIVQRNVINKSVYDAMLYWRGMGKPVVVDLDDAYHFLPYSNPARPFWFERPFDTPEGNIEPGGAIRMLEEGLRNSNGLVSPNRLLLADWVYASKNSYYLQNFAEPGWWGVPPPGPWHKPGEYTYRWYRQGQSISGLPPRSEAKKQRGLQDKIVIGWGGSLSHYDSFWGSGLMQAIPILTQKFSQITWILCGAEQRLFEQFPVPDTNKFYQPGVPPQLWPQVVRTFDIGLAPLFGPYDQRRSWIKGIEYGLAGVPWVGTEGETYKELQPWPAAIQGPETALFWQNALTEMIVNLDRWQAKANDNVGVAQHNFIIDNNLPVFENVMRQIIEDAAANQNVLLPNVLRVTLNGKEKDNREETNAAEPGLVTIQPGGNTGR